MSESVSLREKNLYHNREVCVKKLSVSESVSLRGKKMGLEQFARKNYRYRNRSVCVKKLSVSESVSLREKKSVSRAVCVKK